MVGDRLQSLSLQSRRRKICEEKKLKEKKKKEAESVTDSGFIRHVIREIVENSDGTQTSSDVKLGQAGLVLGWVITFKQKPLCRSIFILSQILFSPLPFLLKCYTILSARLQLKPGITKIKHETDIEAGSDVRRKHKHKYGGPQLSRQKQFSNFIRNFTVCRRILGFGRYKRSV